MVWQGLARSELGNTAANVAGGAGRERGFCSIPCTSSSPSFPPFHVLFLSEEYACTQKNRAIMHFEAPLALGNGSDNEISHSIRAMSAARRAKLGESGKLLQCVQCAHPAGRLGFGDPSIEG